MTNMIAAGLPAANTTVALMRINIGQLSMFGLRQESENCACRGMECVSHWRQHRGGLRR